MVPRNTKTALVILHSDFEEIEAITTIDVLDRAGIDITIASREESLNVTGRSGITVLANALLPDALGDTYDVLIIPGGPGTPRMLDDERILQAIKEYINPGKILAAICAAPIILQKAGVLVGKRFTSHNSVWNLLPEVDRKHAVLTDNNLVTGNGPAAAIPFALAIVESVLGRAQADITAEHLGFHR